MDRQEIIRAAGSSIEMFGRLFMSKALSAAVPDFHREIYRDLEDNSIKRLGIIAPRGHSKSTVTSILFPLWRTIFKPPEEDLLILLISESQSQSINFLNVIKYNLEANQRILQYFGSLRGDKWTEDDFTTSNGVRIMAKGTGQKIRGTLMGREAITRPNLIILDDFESETNSATKEAIEKNKDWITKAVEPSLSDDGRLVGVGTIISKMAFLEDIQKPGSGWKTHFYQAFADGKAMRQPLWPERFSKERLMEIKSSYEARGKAAAFWQEYMNEPIDMDNQTFSASDFRRYSDDTVFELLDGEQLAIRAKHHPLREKYGWAENVWVPLNPAVGVDLAISEDHRADFTVNFAMAMDFDENRFILPYDRIREKDIDNIVNAMINKCLETGSYHINIETIQYQQAVANQFRKKSEERGLYFGISETRPRTAKDSRIRSLQPLFRQHKVFMANWMLDMEEELLNFPSAAHDDILDAMWLAEQVLTPPDLDVFTDVEEIHEFEEEEEESWLVL